MNFLNCLQLKQADSAIKDWFMILLKNPKYFKFFIPKHAVKQKESY
jgi:hypothetical protein